jgi:AraC-like DNA-binding protein
MGPAQTLTAWRPAVAGVAEVLHARMTGHAYPLHTHDTWTVLIVDAGAVSYDLDRHHHGALRDRVTLLPPHVAHDGRSATGAGFRKRVVYLDGGVLDVRRAGRAVDAPGLVDGDLRAEVHQLHRALASPGDEVEAEDRLARVVGRLSGHLGAPSPTPHTDTTTARWLRAWLDDRADQQVTLGQASAEIGLSTTHLVRAFSATYGLPPHRYLTGRRLDHARRLLLTGRRPAEVAVTVGFHDQSHLTRHFRRLLGVTPGTFARE